MNMFKKHPITNEILYCSQEELRDIDFFGTYLEGYNLKGANLKGAKYW
jgi:uncharacterized protein YjbI with pentapeptide repeats